ncbi:MAG: sigma-70 factor domain-containing protein, partial [Actinomycetes bacterium]
MPVSRAPKNSAAVKKTATKVAAKKSAPAKKVAATAKKTTAKKVAAVKKPNRFPTKAELEALRVAREAEEQAKLERKKAHRFPTKAEIEARKRAEQGLPPIGEEVEVSATISAPATKGGKPVVTKIDGEEVELEEVELEDLETLVEEVTEIVETEKEEQIRVVNVAEESQNETNAFTIKDSEEDDAPAQTVLTAGATADPVKDYLKLIGRVPLLNAEMEVEL